MDIRTEFYLHFTCLLYICNKSINSHVSTLPFYTSNIKKYEAILVLYNLPAHKHNIYKSMKSHISPLLLLYTISIYYSTAKE